MTKKQQKHIGESRDVTDQLEDIFLSQDESLSFLFDSLGSDDADKPEDLYPILSGLSHVKGRYKELGLIAEGGEKRITLVYDRCLNRQVAMARAVHAETLQNQERFLKEAHIAANLSHPNIMPIYNIGLDAEGMPFFTMELAPGDNLKSMIKRFPKTRSREFKPDAEESLLSIFIKICDAIDYAHHRGVIHLDLKPDNIHIGKFGEVLVCDWGLSQVLSSSDPSSEPKPIDALDGDLVNEMTLTGILKGTPGFMAPEQATPGEKKTPQTDIYSLGAILYLLQTGSLPISGASTQDLLEKTRTGSLDGYALVRRSRKKTANLLPVAMKAMSLKPEDRYESVRKLRDEVQRFLNGHATHAEHANVGTRLSLLIRRHNKIAFMLILFLSLLAVLTSLALVGINQEKQRAVTARNLAEDAFSLYKKQLHKTVSLGGHLGRIINYASSSRDYRGAGDLLQFVTTSLDLVESPQERNQLLKQKGTLHFILQQFQQGANAFNNAKDLDQMQKDMARLCVEYQHLKADGTSPLSSTQLANLIMDAKRPNNAVFYLYTHTHSRSGYSPEESVPIVQAMLNRLNRVYARKQCIQLQVQDGGRHLELVNHPYKHFSLDNIGLSHIALLKPLQLDSLTIDHAESFLKSTGSLTLKELRIVEPFRPNRYHSSFLASKIKLMKIKKLRLPEGSLPPDILDELRTHMEVFEE